MAPMGTKVVPNNSRLRPERRVVAKINVGVPGAVRPSKTCLYDVLGVVCS